MLVEVIGLPGAGKTSLCKQLAQLGGNDALAIKGLRDEALKASVEGPKANRFFRRRPERKSMYGSMSFRRQNPELFDLFCSRQDEKPVETLWNMELLSQLFFAEDSCLGEDVLLADEGLAHRGVSYFYDDGSDERLKAFYNCLPPSYLTKVCFYEISVDLSLERALGPGRGMSTRKRGEQLEDTKARIRRFESAMLTGLDILKARGVPVFPLDATCSIEENALALATNIRQSH